MTTDTTIAIYTKTGISSGAGLFAQELAHGMIDRGGQVIFIAPAAESRQFDEPRKGLTRMVSVTEARSGPKWYRALTSMGRMLSGAWGCFKARVRTRVFVVTIPDPLVFAVPLLALLRLTGARIIYVVHDPLPHSWKLPPRLRKVEDAAYAAAYRLSSALVVLSAAGAATLRNAYRTGDSPIEVIEHGTFVLPGGSPAPGDGELLLFGTLRTNKGVHDAIAGTVLARERGAAVRLRIAGSPDPVEPEYWRACEALALAHRAAVTLEIGYVSNARLQELIAGADALIMPYRNFASQSGVATIAGSNGRAVIAPREGGIGDLINDGMAAQVISAPVDAERVADAIVAFAATPIATWNERARAFLHHTRQTRAWDVIGAQYLRLAERIDR